MIEYAKVGKREGRREMEGRRGGRKRKERAGREGRRKEGERERKRREGRRDQGKVERDGETVVLHLHPLSICGLAWGKAWVLPPACSVSKWAESSEWRAESCCLG